MAAMTRRAPRSRAPDEMPDSDRDRLSVIDVRMRGVESDFHSLKSDVTGQFNSISAQITALASKVDERGRIPWPALGVMLGFITVIGGMAYVPIKETQGTLEKKLDGLESTYISEKQVLAMATTQEIRKAETAKALDVRFNTVESDVMKLRSEIVPRIENQNSWDNYRVRHEELQRQIDEIKRDYTNIYSPKDEISNLQIELRDIERRLNLPVIPKT